MAGFNSRDHIINNITNLGQVQVVNFQKNQAQIPTVSTWQTLWNGSGTPTAGSFTNTGAQTSSTQGALQVPALSSLSPYLISFGAVATNNCTLMVYDRLFVSSENTANTVTNVAKSYTTTINSTTALPRYAGLATGGNALLNEAWLEFSAILTTTGNITALSYGDGGAPATNVGNPVSLSSVNIPIVPSGSAVGTMFQLPLGGTTRGVKSVTGVTFNAGVAGSHRVVILRPLARIPLLANIWNEVSFLDDVLGLPTIEANPCLGLAILGPSTATNVYGSMTWAYA